MDGVKVEEQWAVHSEDGQIYRVDGDDRGTTVREVSLLRAGVDGEPGEKLAAAAHRFVVMTPHGETVTGWRWTPGGDPCCEQEV
jgi:hypothetical protein